MSRAISNIEQAMSKAMAEKPKVGGFPYLAECLRRVGVTQNLWFLPACESIYLTNDGPVVSQATPLLTGLAEVPSFDQEALIRALRIDQAGDSTFPEFIAACFRAGVVRYNADFEARTVAYYGCYGEEYLEAYSAVDVH
ncbi:MAG TPA: DUF1398 family protein [Chthoniobacterales bacterium]